MANPKTGEGFFQSDDVRLHYRTRGEPGRPAVVCLHGGAHTLHAWDDLAARLADRWFVAALDQRGHGDSEWSPEGRYARDNFAADIGRLLDHLGLPAAAFVGHSLGGNNALRFTVLHPERVRRLVIADVGPEIGPRYRNREATDIAAPPVRDTLEEFLDEAMRRNPRRGRGFYERVLAPNLRHRPDGKWTWKHDPRFLQIREEFSEEIRAERWRTLAEVPVPVLIVRGERSTTLTEEVAERMARTLPNARRVTLAGAGHNVHLDDPDGFAAVVIPFLEEELG